MKNPFRSQFPWVKDAPEPELSDDIYLDGFTGFHSRVEERAEANRVRVIEARNAEAQVQGEAGNLDGFKPGVDYGAFYGASNLPK